MNEVLREISDYIEKSKDTYKICNGLCEYNEEDGIIVKIQPSLVEYDVVTFVFNKEGINVRYYGTDKYTLSMDSLMYKIRNDISDIIRKNNIKERMVNLEQLVFKGTVYNDGDPISQQEYDRMKVNNELDNDTYYLIKPNNTEYLLDKLNEELLKIVEPRMSDFTGYNEETNSFDIIQALKEIIEDLEDTIEDQKQKNR